MVRHTKICSNEHTSITNGMAHEAGRQGLEEETHMVKSEAMSENASMMPPCRTGGAKQVQHKEKHSTRA